MNILFTTRDEWFSNNIRKMTKAPVSHCALEFPEYGFILHSNIRGIHLEWSKNFRRKNKVIYEINILSDRETDFDKIDKLLKLYEFKPYDKKAISYLAIYMFLKNTCHISLPKHNLWQTTGMFLCTEWVTKYLDGKEDSMITPYKLYLRLKNEEQNGRL